MEKNNLPTPSDLVLYQKNQLSSISNLESSALELAKEARLLSCAGVEDAEGFLLTERKRKEIGSFQAKIRKKKTNAKTQLRILSTRIGDEGDRLLAIVEEERERLHDIKECIETEKTRRRKEKEVQARAKLFERVLELQKYDYKSAFMSKICNLSNELFEIALLEIKNEYEQKKAEEEKKKLEQTKQEEEQKKLEEEKRKLEEEKLEEQKKLEQIKQEEEQKKLEEEKRKLEEQQKKLEEEKRKLEEEQKKQEEEKRKLEEEKIKDWLILNGRTEENKNQFKVIENEAGQFVLYKKISTYGF